MQGLTELATAFGELQEQVDEGGADEIAPLEARVALLEGDFQEVQVRGVCFSCQDKLCVLYSRDVSSC